MATKKNKAQEVFKRFHAKIEVDNFASHTRDFSRE